MLIVGLVETGPDTFLLQLQAETGEIVEYTVSKNDKNFWSQSLIENRSQYPIGGGCPLASLAPISSAELCATAQTGWLASERVARAAVAVIANDSQQAKPSVCRLTYCLLHVDNSAELCNTICIPTEVHWLNSKTQHLYSVVNLCVRCYGVTHRNALSVTNQPN